MFKFISETLVTYYRLRQVDYNGDSETFDPISVRRNPTGEIFVSPNPVKDVLNIETEVEVAGNYTFAFTSMSGKQVVNQRYLEKGVNHIQLNTNELANGFYLLQVLDMNGVLLTTKKLVKEE